ncbi:hypothetical protein [Phaeobacter sp. B1627]|uniref:hypothetical protein n=1 Tax=Phaeobacter sp. B1627 TaxID=2583809 RepID=UPI001118B521|nr:hypothetical protein [Phaeobacter sp. B1627]TNJ46717.1 hypothetical protein FGE21_04640 [Phaeobacter sp. B1627]
MTSHTSETLIDISADLLRSLHDSLRRARKASETYLAQFEAEQDINPDTATLKPQIAKLDGLIRDIQKVEKTLVDHEKTSGATGMVAFDLRAARDEIERRLAGLRAAIHDADAAGGDG